MNQPVHKRSVIVYRNELLPPSETFIAAQAAALETYVPIFAGMKRMRPTLALPEESVVTLTSGDSLLDRLRRASFITAGFGAGFAESVRKREPALIHAHFAPDASILLPLLQRIRVPLVVTLHGFDVTTHDRVFRQSVQGRAYLSRREKLWNTADCFICVSDFIRRVAIERGFPPSKLWKHFIGIDLDSFTPDPGVMREPIILFVGRLTEKKGCSHLIRAMARVGARVPEARLIIIGDGPLRGTLEAEARSLRSCEFLGVQAQSTIKGWMNRSRVFCVPSIVADSGDAEGLGMVFCEAQAMGLPVVSFASGGIPEAVQDGVTGLLAPEGDDECLARHIESYLVDDRLWMDASAAGRRHVEQGFDLRRQTRILEEKYDQVCRDYCCNPATSGIRTQPMGIMGSPTLE